MAPAPEITSDADHPGRRIARGDWVIGRTAGSERWLAKLRGPAEALDATGIGRLDAAGALLLAEALARLELDSDALRLRDDHRALFEAVGRVAGDPSPALGPAEPAWKASLVRVGMAAEAIFRQSVSLLGFLGLTLKTLGRTALKPGRLRLTSTVHHMQQTGLDAVPLVGLLSFLIGAVIAFLGATVLREFGAELFVVELVSFAFLREFGVLLTAILLAGRTASAFTAQIGTMKSREEIDAIRTLGLDPIELLVIPRLLALIVMLPLLAFIAMMTGLAGGMAVAIASLGMPLDLYLTRLAETMELRHYLVGMSKAPVFAFVIALIGCQEGFKVTGTAQSVGERTTSAVVQSISLVIIINALAAVFYMEIGL